MDKVLNGIVDEVALEGDQGCTVDKLFILIETLLTKALKDTPLHYPILFDDRYKSYLWQQIKHNAQLLFIESGKSIDPSDLTYDQLKSKDFLVQTTEQVLDRNIYGSSKDAKKSLNEKQRHILNSIAKSRNQGISQYELGELFHMDSKTIFYHVKKLNQLGLIVKEDAYVSRMITKLLFLKRFASQPSSEDNKNEQHESVIYRLPAFKEDINKVLEQQPDHIMPIPDLLEALSLNTITEKKWARVRIQEMHELGEIEKINATDGKRLRQCVRLISASTASSTATTSHVLQEDATQPMNPFAMDRDLPCDLVFYRDVEAAAEKGLTRQDLIDKYPFIDPVQTKIFFDSATFPPKTSDLMPYMLHCTEEMLGRTRQFRYYTQSGWRALNEANGIQTTEEPSSTIAANPKEPEILSEPTSIDEISRILTEPARKRVHYSKEKYQARKETAAKKRKTTADNTPASTPPSNDVQVPPSQIPSKRAIEETNDKTVSPTTKKRGKKDSIRNMTKTRRYGIILQMVEKAHIRELNGDMMNEFRSIELETHEGQKIARQTFDDLIKELHDQQKLRIYVTAIKKPNGLTDIKKFVLHASLTGESPQVKEFIGHYHVQKPIMVGPSRRKDIKAVAMPVLPHSNQLVDKSAMTIVGNSNSWRVSAVEYGWVPSKWIRAKVLHVNLFQYLASKDIQDDMVDMTDFLRWIRLQTVMQIYGLLPYDDPTLKAFLGEEQNRDMAICDLPADIKAIVSQAAPRIRVRIVHLIQVLCALSLVEVEGGAMSKYSIPPKIQLLKQGIVRDYATSGHPVRFTLQLNDASNVQLFWRDLQRCCVEKRTKADTIHDENDILYNIVLVRLWRSNTLLSKRQKAILDSFVDFDAKTVPNDDDRTLRVHIARKTDLSPKRVQAYYNSVLVSFRKYTSRREKEEERAAKKNQSLKAAPAIVELMQASMERRKVSAAMVQLKQEGPFVQPTFVASRKLRRLRLAVGPEEGARKKHAKNVDNRLMNNVEKDVLIHAYSIMKARADTSLFYWSPIAKVLASYTPNRSRRTIDYMTRLDPRLLDTIQKLKADWKEIYQEGIAKGDIKDDAPWDTQDYDLPGFLEYFILKLQEREKQADAVVPLPRQLSDFDSNFSIVRDGNPTSAADNDGQIAAYTHCFDEHVYDICTSSMNHYDEQKVSVYLVMILIKMILITPDNKYSTKDAYMLLREYPEKAIEQAVDKLTEMGMLMRGKAGFGRIPGRGINVSEKFLIVAAGALPFEFFKQAKQFHDALASTSSFIDLEASDINSGAVAAVFDLASQGKISIGLQDVEKYIKPKQSTYYPKASAVALRKAYVYKDLDLRITPTCDLSGSDVPENCLDHDAVVYVSTHEEIKAMLHVLNGKRPLSEALYDIVCSFGKAGSSISEIRAKFDGQHQFEDSLLFFETLESLQNHIPPLICIIGFEHLRYVASEFISDWFIKQNNMRYILPLMWYDTTGSIIPDALEGCASAIMSHILKRPGISFATLRDTFRGFYTDFELYHILKYLLDSKQIMSRTVQRAAQPKRVSIFDKRTLVSMATAHHILNNNEITCYWLARDYYL